jgi:hypothetical protein
VIALLVAAAGAVWGTTIFAKVQTAGPGPLVVLAPGIGDLRAAYRFLAKWICQLRAGIRGRPPTAVTGRGQPKGWPA